MTHNVSGLSSALVVATLVDTWALHQPDVVCLQESWVGRPGRGGRAYSTQEVELWLRQATDARSLPAYVALWANNTSLPAENNGVAILVRPSPHLLVSHHLPSSCGRLQCLRVTWGGHDFVLVNTYWPSTGAAARGAFLRDTLAPALPPALPVCLLGDFNFTPSPTLDRQPLSHSTAASDAVTATALTAAQPLLVDVFRKHHPTARSFTFHRGGCLARLDRAYMSPALAGSSLSAAVVSSPHGDHHAMLLHLLPALPLHPRGPGRRTIPSSLPLHQPAAVSLEAWASRAVEYGLTLSSSDLLAWWPDMQAAYAAHARGLLAARTSARAAQQAPLRAAHAASEDARLFMALAGPSTLPSAILRVARTAADVRVAARGVATPLVASATRAWLHQNEQPSPLIAALTRPPPVSSLVAALAARDGSRVTSNEGIAACLNAHYAAVSDHSPTDPASQHAVLAALIADVAAGAVSSIPPTLAHAAGAAGVSTAEVIAALRHAPSSSAPGPDGLPYSMWKVGRFCWAPLLARLFTAIASEGRLPRGFNLGTITPILKPLQPDAAHPAAYRPITLLPALYRVLAKILAARFGVALAQAIGPEQTAYLPGRLIGDNVLFTSLLSPALSVTHSSGAVVFIDISKAYDTVDRAFIFSLLTSLGASDGMVNWARLLLHATAASTHVNGVESPPAATHAGVRQGCPLSPLLYLVVAQALTSWLRAQPLLGVTVDGVRHITAQYADDTQVLLGDFSPAALHSLTAALATFASASGQRINPAKSSALFVGDPLPAPAPASLATISVVGSATSLGIPHSTPPSPPAPPLRARFTRAALRPACTRPQPAAPHALHAWAQRLLVAGGRMHAIARLPLSPMGRGLGMSAYALSTFLYHAEFAGLPPTLDAFSMRLATAVDPAVPPPLLHGRPAHGGFGLLPLRQHVLARHASTASRLLSYLLPPSPSAPSSPPAPAPARPPPWVGLASVLLRHACPALHPAQSLLAATLATAEEACRGVVGPPSLPQHARLPPGPMTDMVVALQCLGPLSAPESSPPPRTTILTPAASGLSRAALAGLHWPHPRSTPAQLHPPLVPANGVVPVRLATMRLMAPEAALRTSRHAAFVRLAFPAPPPPLSPAIVLARFQASLAAAWRVPCDNRIKATLWRVALDAVPGARVRPWACPCCAPGPPATSGRQHTFWECSVALAVRGQLDAGMALAVTRPSLWLLAPPPSIPPGLWSLVALTALAAMDHGRRLLWALASAPSWPAPGPARVLAVQAVGDAAALYFWAAIGDFAFAHPTPPHSVPVLASTPFLAVRDGRVVALLPPPSPPSSPALGDDLADPFHAMGPLALLAASPVPAALGAA